MARELAALKTRIGGRIKGRRATLRISQEHLAFEVDVSPTYLSQIEAGKRNVSLDVLYRIAKALKLELSELVNG
jgi:transcriptional regulator with XRE-family HTH domain